MNNYGSDSVFSKKWMILSMIIFITTEIILGGFIGKVVVGKYLSISLRFFIQGLLNLLSYFLGGFVIGAISPGIRIYEPAAGAFLSVAAMLCMSFFTPYSFIHFSLQKMIIGGVIAFFLALYGARLGEKLTNKKRI